MPRRPACWRPPRSSRRSLPRSTNCDLPLVVVDPVMIATSGDPLLDEDAHRRCMRAELLPRALVVTPNIPEAEMLSGCRIALARRRPGSGAAHSRARTAAVVITGGHGDGDERRRPAVRRPTLSTSSGRARRHDRNMHGTGCTFASAVAAHLALGDAARRGSRARAGYVAGAIRHGLADRARATGRSITSGTQAADRPRFVTSQFAILSGDGSAAGHRRRAAVARIRWSGWLPIAGRRLDRTGRWRRFSASSATTTRDGRCSTWNTRRSSRWRCGRSSASPRKSAVRLAGRAAGAASPDRTARDRRGQRRDRRRFAASRGRVFGLPVRHRAREADRADLEARVLRRRRRVDRGRHGGSRRCTRRARRRSGSHACDGAAVRTAARHRRRRRTAARGGAWRDGSVRLASARAASSRSSRRYERSISSAVNADYARMDDRVRDGDEVAFLPPVSGGDESSAAERRHDRSRSC